MYSVDVCSSTQRSMLSDAKYASSYCKIQILLVWVQSQGKRLEFNTNVKWSSLH